jgi:hypothetical protein
MNFASVTPFSIYNLIRDMSTLLSLVNGVDLDSKRVQKNMKVSTLIIDDKSDENLLACE